MTTPSEASSGRDSCPRCGAVLVRRAGGRALCVRCESLAESGMGVSIAFAGDLGRAMVDGQPPDLTGPPVPRANLEWPPLWTPCERSADLSTEGRADLSLALGLVERGIGLEPINRHLLLCGPRLSLAQILRLFRTAPEETLEEALREPRLDPVKGWAGWKCAVLGSRSRLVLRSSDVPVEVGPYQIACRLGRGGMGEVFLGFRPGLDQDLAVKSLDVPESERKRALERLHREAQALARLRHPNIVSLVNVSLEGPRPHLAMAYVPGLDLGHWLARGLPLTQVVRLVQKVARALFHAHRAGILHRDVKPQNILVDLEGEPYLVDFGLARIVDAQRLTGSRELLGTPFYMPPEHVVGPGPYTERSDIYSLGVVLYECLTGRVPYQGESLAEVLAKVMAGGVTGPRELVPEIPVDLEQLCLSALSRDPGKRPGSAAAIADRLEFWQSKELVRQAARRDSRRWLPAVVALVFFLAALVVLALSLVL